MGQTGRAYDFLAQTTSVLPKGGPVSLAKVSLNLFCIHNGYRFFAIKLGQGRVRLNACYVGSSMLGGTVRNMEYIYESV